MKKQFTSILLYLIVILGFQPIDAQNKVKLNLKKIELAYYEVKDNTTKVDIYAQINQNGSASVYLEGNYGLKFYKYQLPEKLIIEINRFIAQENYLENSTVRKKLDPGYHYAGSYTFITFENKPLCFVEPFMSSEFNSIYNQLENILLQQSKNSEIKDPKFNMNEIEKRVLAQHKKTNYLPKIEQPPR